MMSVKRIVECNETCSFDGVLGEKVTLFCGVYIYVGVLSAVHDECLELSEPEIVYETGKLDSGEWKDSQSLPSPWRVMRQGIESWGPAKC